MTPITVEYLSELWTTPVPRDTAAPWLRADADKSQLVQDFRVLVDGERIVVPAGYVSDWASIPRPLWWIWPPTYGPARHGAWVHDYIYSHLWRDYTKRWADRALAACMRHDNAAAATAIVWHWAVHLGGRGGWHYSQDPDADPFWRTEER